VSSCFQTKLMHSQHCSSRTHTSLAQVPDISQSLLDFPGTCNRQTYEYWKMPGMLWLLVNQHSGVYGVANDAPAAGSVCAERLYTESMHSSSSAAGMAGEAKLLCLIRRSLLNPNNPAVCATKKETKWTATFFCAPGQSPC